MENAIPIIHHAGVPGTHVDNFREKTGTLTATTEQTAAEATPAAAKRAVIRIAMNGITGRMG